MDTRLTNIDEAQLDRLYEQARRYPLLTAEQEREADGRKWAAVAAARHAVLACPQGRSWVARLIEGMLERPPRIEQFQRREHFFVLRRELAEYTASESRRNNLAAAGSLLRRRRTRAAEEACLALDWSASLWIGIAAALARRLGGRPACRVADALDAWADSWPATRSRHRSGTDSLDALERSLSSFNAARDTLTLHNLRLVYTIAGRHTGRGVPLTDLIQEGSLGLMRAAEKYDHRLGNRFSTYCFNWISQAVRRAVGDTGAIIRYPAHVREQVNKLHAKREELLLLQGRAPTDRSLASATGIDLTRTRELRQLRNVASSLQTPVHDDGDTTLGDQLPDEHGDTAIREAEVRSLHRAVLREIQRLNDTERSIVLARWGLQDGPPLSRGEVADKLDVSREWVRQLEVSALEKLRESHTLLELFDQPPIASPGY